MSIKQIAMLCCFSLLLVTGQILFKYAALSQQKMVNVADLVSLRGNGFFIAACLMYALTTILWVVALQQVPLSRAYPFTALGFVLVPAAAALLFGETVNMRYLFGAVLIGGGIVLAAGAPSSS